MCRIALAVGLTGGHIYPARALAEDLGRDRHEFLFIVRASSPLAKKLLEDEGFPVLAIKARGLPRNFKEAVLCSPLFFWEQLRGFLLLLRAFRDWRPSLVIGFGGYVSFPAILAAWVLRVSRVIFEPNAKLGLANRALAFISNRVVSAFDIPIKNALIIQSPLRKSLHEALRLTQESCRDFFGLDRNIPCVLVFGGSQGAQALNEAFRGVMERLVGEGLVFSFIHITGTSHYTVLKDFYEAKHLLGPSGACLSYLEDMGKAYRAASLVVSRSGAMTCLELMHFKTPALLVPLASATESHQLANALALERLGLAEVVQENSQLFESLSQSLKRHLEGSQRTDKIQDNIAPISQKSFKDVVLDMFKSNE